MFSLAGISLEPFIFVWEVVMRRRNNMVKVAFTDDEYNMLVNKIKESGKPNVQSYALDALLNSEVTSQALVDELVNMNKNFSELNRIDRGIANNLNQLTKCVNSKGIVDVNSLDLLLDSFTDIAERRNELWLQIRSYLTMQKHIHQ